MCQPIRSGSLLPVDIKHQMQPICNAFLFAGNFSEHQNDKQTESVFSSFARLYKYIWSRSIMP